ncbi:Uncharacterised protein [Staphylococcus aureus]|nr:Uncharacterised protein [Staphylococcus aureus]
MPSLDICITLEYVLALFKADFCSRVAFLSILVSELLSLPPLFTSFTKAPVQAEIPIIININKTRQPPQPNNQPFLRFFFFSSSCCF